MGNQSPEDALHSCKNTCHILHTYFKHTIAPQNIFILHAYTHMWICTEIIVFANKAPLLKDATFFLTSIKQEAKAALKMLKANITWSPRKKKKKHTHMHTHTQQQHVPEPPAIRSDEWCTDPIRQIHTSRCSEIFPTKGVQIKKCPPGNDQMFHQKGTETSPIQQVPCLSGICLFPVWNPPSKTTLGEKTRRKPGLGLEISEWDLGRFDLVLRFDPYQL